MSDPENLTPKQEALIAALLGTSSIKRAAERVGITERTAYRWRKLPHFREAFREARRDVHENAVGILQNYSGTAAATLVKLLDSDNDHVRARAARIILDQAARGVETYDLEERLQRLEEEFDE